MKSLITGILLSLSCILHAQTLFTYGPHKVGKDEFLKAFRKNNPAGHATDSLVRDYLDMYIRFKLKVRVALDLKMDTLYNQQADLESFRRQIEAPFLTDAATLQTLAEEAYRRSLTEIRVSHIFIPFRTDFAANTGSPPTPTAADSSRAKQVLDEVENRIKKGESFEKLAREFSGDPEAAKNGGDIGFITVFTLPYAFENTVYALPENGVSGPVISRAGYHIFKKNGQRPAVGRIKAAQILLAYPPDASQAEQDKQRKLADSLYQVLRSGGSFEALARQFSNDKTTAPAGGVMPEFGTGYFDPVFEKAAFSLQHNGDISLPVQTSFGYHLIRRDDRIPVEKDPEVAIPRMKKIIAEEPRGSLARKVFEDKLPVVTGYHAYRFDEKNLRAVTDSFLSTHKKLTIGGIAPSTKLFGFLKKDISVSEWLNYALEVAQSSQNKPNPYPELFPAFISASTLEYYREHLEDFDPSYHAQLSEFRDGNLLFQVMEEQVWDKAAKDSAGLAAYYRSHAERYNWGPGADAIFFSATDSLSAKSVYGQLRQKPANWRQVTESAGGSVFADSARYELAQLGESELARLRAGSLTDLRENETDQTFSFWYIVRTYDKASPRSFEDARGLVINDYQQFVEEQWIAELRKKYPVKVNEAVLNEILHSL
jgi:peptidyl-prolyl cis-trans isomerase SurA